MLRDGVGKSTSLDVRGSQVHIGALSFISFMTSGKLLHLLGYTFLIYEMEIVLCKIIGILEELR